MAINVTFRFKDDFYKRIMARCESDGVNRTELVVKALEQYLNPSNVEVPELTESEKKQVANGAKRINDLLNDAITRRMQRDNSFIENMDSKDFAHLVAGRLPKEAVDDADVERDVLSLKELVEGLPDVADVTRELSILRGKLKQVEMERDIAREVWRKHKGGSDVRESARLIYGLAVEYCWDCIIRNSLPGIGDGGGLTAAGREAIAKRVEEDLKEVKI